MDQWIGPPLLSSVHPVWPVTTDRTRESLTLSRTFYYYSNDSISGYSPSPSTMLTHWSINYYFTPSNSEPSRDRQTWLRSSSNPKHVRTKSPSFTSPCYHCYQPEMMMMMVVTGSRRGSELNTNDKNLIPPRQSDHFPKIVFVFRCPCCLRLCRRVGVEIKALFNCLIGW